MQNREEKSGIVFDMSSSSLKERRLSDCISIFAFEQGYILNRDGSIAVGFEASLFEEDSLDGGGFVSAINAFSLALKRLPIGTVIQKMDVYHEEDFSIFISEEDPFFKKKTLEHFNGRNTLRHTSFIYFRFFCRELDPIKAPLGRFNRIFKDSFSNFEEKQKVVQRALEELISFLPPDMKLRKMSDEENESILYKYTSLAFDRNPIGFDSSMFVQDDKLVVGGYLKSVRIKRQPDEAFYFKKNNLGNGGVASGFLWPITHFAYFPHIISQQIEIINDKKFIASKNNELKWTSFLKIGERDRRISEDRHEKFTEIDKELAEKNSQVVKFSSNVFVWHPLEDVLQTRINYIKGAFGKVGVDSEEEAEKTAHSFFSSIPGGCGFFEGMYMPIETAVAHLNFITPRKGDEEGVLLSDRHGRPIFYDPFKYSLYNPHGLIFGPTGSGKSFFNGKMIKDRFYAGHTMVVIDSGGTYRNLFKAIGGKYIEYDPEKPLALNPFFIRQQGGKYEPEEDKIEFLINFIAKMWKGDLKNNRLSQEEYAILSKALNFYYKGLDGKDIPTLRGFCKWLPDYVGNNKLIASLFKVGTFLLILEPFTEGKYKEHFNSLEELNVEDSRLICFELQAVQGNEKLYPLVVKVLFESVLELAAKQPDQKKFIDIEEGWTMLDDSSSKYIESFFRRGRKENISIRIITQEIVEIKDSPIAAAMKGTSTAILLYNEKESVRKEIAEFLGLDEFDMEKYASLTRKGGYRGGFREIFIKEMSKTTVWRMELSLFEHAIITSRPDERNAINKLIKELGDVELAACQWVKQTLEKEQKYE